MAGLMWLLVVALSALGLAAQLDLDCAKPESARALIDYAQLSEIEQVEDIHRDELDKALARCPAGSGRERCQAERRREAEADWNRKVAEIKARYQRMKEEFEERCRASLVLGLEATGSPRSKERVLSPRVHLRACPLLAEGSRGVCGGGGKAPQ